MTNWSDTIVALATPPGVGALGIIRVSGTEAFPIVNRLFPSKDLLEQQSHSLHVGFLKAGEKMIDEVVVSLYRAPRSYTGEDVIEISCHGSPFIQQEIIQACLEEGARLARPGEFTQRAFLNGKMDLAQAEAVADLIASNTEAARDTAIHAMRGGFSDVLKELREQLLKFSALMELELDFSQEDVEFADRSQFYKLLHEAKWVTMRLLESFRYGNVVKNGVRVAIVGKPNAGKSTLLNGLLNENRAIVSDIAGTTRDTIEEVLNIDGVLFRLIDTAGIRDHTYDLIERAGIEKTFEKIKGADLVLYIFDVNETRLDQLEAIPSLFDVPEEKLLLVGNKTDLAEPVSLLTFANALLISAKTDPRLDALKKEMYDRSVNKSADETVVTNARHFDALRNVDSALNDILQGLDASIPTDLIALDVRRCLHYLGEITGEITNDEQLGYIFGKFCIGK